MKTTRKRVLDYYDNILTNEDIVFYIGKDIYNEARDNKCFGRHYVDNELVDYFSIAEGIATATSKRVMVIFEDSYLLRYFNSFLQAGVSELKNLFFVMLITNSYADGVKQPTIFKTLKSTKGVLFSAGFLTHIYTKFFINKPTLMTLNDVYARIRGPAVGLIDIENIKLSNSANTHEFEIKEFIKFIRTEEEDAPPPPEASVELILKAPKEKL